MKVLRENGTVEFEGTPSECGLYCRKRDKKIDEQKSKKPITRQSSRFEKIFANPTFVS